MTIKLKTTVNFPYLTRINDRFGGNKYEVTLGDLSEPAKNALTELGLKVYHKDGIGNKITCKSINPIKVYDTEGNELDGDKVGSGSTAVAMVSFYENSYGKFPQLSRLVITNLVEYAPNTLDVSVDADDDIL